MEVDQDEEVYVLAELAGSGLDDLLKNEPTPMFKIIGLGGPETMLQIGPHIYSGKVENSATTNLFFKKGDYDSEKAGDEIDEDLQHAPEKWTSYLGKSCKVLKMHRVFPRPKGDAPVEEVITNERIDEVNIEVVDGGDLSLLTLVDDGQQEQFASDPLNASSDGELIISDHIVL